jgi:hypothetical protein
MRVLGATRLRVLNSLPRPHQDHFFEEVRVLCAKFITLAARHDRKIDRASETLALFSEVMAKLLGVAGVEAKQEAADGEAQIRQVWMVDEDPKRDGRVAWLIDQVGGPHALAHRYEDIRRRAHGGKWREDGYRHVQLQQEHIENLSVEPEDPHRDEEIQRIWLGVLAMAETQFEPHDDVSMLLQLMACDSDIQASFGAEWPIRKIVDALNCRHSSPPWNDHRVENAKKRLRNWIARLKRDNGLDSVGLMELFARQAHRRASESAATPYRATTAPVTTSE